MSQQPAPRCSRHVVAVIGGGQLARMMAEPAAALGIPLRLLAEAPGVSAAQVVPDHTVGDYTDLATLRAVTEGCEVVTFDHEHVPTDHLHALESSLAVRPGPEALVHAQDKGVMRRRLAELDVPCPRNALVSSVDEVASFGFPCVLKTTRGGYDGKGVWFVEGPEDCAAAFESGREILAEERVDFRRELSALVARSPSGQVAVVAGGRLDPARRDLPRGDRAGARPRARRWPSGAADRDEDRRRARRHRRARRRAVRDQRRPGAGQRAGDAAAQHRALDPGRLGHQPVREPPARRARPAARRAGGSALPGR